ncbi:hypothetical protein [Candidatus Reidiella endopervernicosa]|nr:hypothetical protein [Candidatus Reidiella endopervernicosa]
MSSRSNDSHDYTWQRVHGRIFSRKGLAYRRGCDEPRLLDDG